MADEWTRIGENLLRHRSGTIYLRAKVGGKVVKLSLETRDIKAAKLKRDARLEVLRAQASAEGKASTVGGILVVLKNQVLSQPHLRPRSREYYAEMFGILEHSLPLGRQTAMWSAKDAAAWWQGIAEKYACQRANNCLGMLKRLGTLMLQRGMVVTDPTADLVRVPMVASVKNIPSRETIEAIIDSIRSQGKSHSDEAAGMVAFLAFAGCRLSQARAVRWEDVGETWLTFAGGIEGAKGARLRKLPISGPLRAILDRMRPKVEQGPIFSLVRPHEALSNACKRLGIPHVRIHDLRHFFATHALQSGVDVQTVSKWLGHKDGGVLVLRTYGHVRDDHSLEQAGKLL